LACWDGSSWTEVASLAGGRAIALAVSGSNLYVGGAFSSVNAVAAACVAHWNGSSWSPLGGGVGAACASTVNGLLLSGSDVYAAGSFFSENGTSNYLNQVGMYAGGWTPLGAGMWHSSEYPCDDAVAFAVEQFDGMQVFGGYWDTAGGQAIPYLAFWDGMTWSSLGSGVDNQVVALEAHDGKLYVGGNFLHAGGKSSKCFGIYDPNSSTGVGTPVASRELRLSPNPFNPATNIAFATEAPGHVRLDVVDARGIVVRTLVNQILPGGAHSARWDGESDHGVPAASGVYMFRLTVERGASLAQKGTLLK